MIHNLLYLTPIDFTAAPDRATIAATLRQLQLIGAPLAAETPDDYTPGSDFFDHLTFLGCSPVVALGARGATGEEFCHIELESHPTPVFAAGLNVKPLRCRRCKATTTAWQPFITAWQHDPERQSDWHCPHCDYGHRLTATPWRKSAGFGRFFIKIWGIFESEAVPSETLLTTLQSQSGVTWHYFYLRGEGGWLYPSLPSS